MIGSRQGVDDDLHPRVTPSLNGRGSRWSVPARFAKLRAFRRRSFARRFDASAATNGENQAVLCAECHPDTVLGASS